MHNKCTVLSGNLTNWLHNFEFFCFSLLGNQLGNSTPLPWGSLGLFCYPGFPRGRTPI